MLNKGGEVASLNPAIFHMYLLKNWIACVKRLENRPRKPMFWNYLKEDDSSHLNKKNSFIVICFTR